MIELLLSIALQLTPAPGGDSPRLLAIKKIHVERLNGGDPAAQIRDMLIAGIQTSRLFTLTENPETADAILKGSAEDLIFTDTFDSNESISARVGIGSRASTTNSNRQAANASVTDRDSVKIRERKHEATAAVRLVARDGDVIWATAKESLGGKFRGASADVADRVVRQLIDDYERARKPKLSPPTPRP